MKSDVLVVGSTQFVGSNLCNYLLQHTRLSIVGTDNLSCGFIGNLQPSLSSKSRFTFYPLNLSDTDLSNKVIDLIDPSYILIDLTNQCIVSEVVNLIEEAAKRNASKCIIIMPSAIEQDNKYFTQYALLSTFLQNKNYKTNNLDIVVLTPCELYGPRQEASGQFASMAIMTLSGVAGVWRTHPSQWLYVKDLFHNVLKFMEPNSLAPGAYSLASKKECSDVDILSFMQSLVEGNRVPLKTTNVEVSSKPGVITAISHFDLESSIEHTLCWYADNKWAWR
jgi:nucleoside-diphosphate-sugar epimerase